MSDKERFGGTARLYGQDAPNILANSHVAIAGIGGVGCWVAEALARTAVGKITLIDLDDLCVTNTNRQLHALTDTVGQPKVDVMAQRIKAINPDCEVICIEDFVASDNVAEVLHNQLDFIVDATDSIKAKAAMIAHCKRNKLPIITIGGAGGQTDPTKIQVGDLSKTIQDPLASKLRNLLRKEYRFSSNPKRKFGISCIFSSEQLVYPQADGSVCQTKNLSDGSVKLDCNNGFGASVAVTGTFGFVAAARVIDKLLEKARAKYPID